MMSILSRGCQEDYFKDHGGNLFFGVRTLKDAFFLDELAGFVSAFPEQLQVTIALSDFGQVLALQQPCDYCNLFY